MKSKKAFTLIELLVVIAIIGLLATISVIALNNARAKARDAKRVADVKQVQTALELFFNDEGRYPTAAEFNSGSISSYSSSTNSTTTYMAIIPAASNPPDGSCSTSTNPYGYSASSDGTSYTLSFCLGGTTGSLAAGSACATPSGTTNVDCTPVPDPSTISGLKLWLKSDAGITQSGGYVSSWADQSGNGNNLTQGTLPDQPLYVSNAFRGYPAIEFNGTSDVMNTAPFSLAQPEDVFIVYEQPTWSNLSSIFDGGSAISMLLEDYPTYPEIILDDAGAWFTSPYFIAGNYHIVEGLFNSSNSALTIDNSATVIGTVSSAWNADGFTLGGPGNGGFGGWTALSNINVAEVLIYNQNLNATDRQNVKSYLNNKYHTY